MTEEKEFLGRGWAFPIGTDQTTGQIALSAFEEDVQQAIRIILETSKGERVMRPDFGCGIHDLVFDVLSTATLRRVELEVDAALRRYEARIDLEAVLVNAAEAERGRLDVSIDYRIRATNQPGNFVYPFYFREGA
ncbi:GPW/gp25 family protein [Ruegeria sp. MALMAid1280]|uniref:GPW/gp25 family protein n=1 Tax=Ruegeria sp. MALMAid1280 TaxID=3411634 RepID=UPI003B9FCD33